MRWAVGLVAVVAVFAVSACSSTEPEPSPSITLSGMGFEELRQANAEFVECVEGYGATVTVNEIDDFGVPDISNTVTWPKITSEIGTPEHDAEIEQIMDWDTACSSTTIDPVRQAYWMSGNKNTVKSANLDKRWEEKLPEVRECFAALGAYVDDNTTRDELNAIFNTREDEPGYLQCLVDARLVTDQGDGFYQVDS